MIEDIPSTSRPAARILLLDPAARLLLLQAREDPAPQTWWIAPGGGLKPNETFREAAARELWEETGVSAPIGPWVWTRRHVHIGTNGGFDQYERFFVAECERTVDLEPPQRDGYIVGHRWWTIDEISASEERFAPRRLARLLPAILEGRFPDPPLDCGV